MANPHRFYIPDLLPAGSTQNLPGPVAHHIRKVLRLRDGDSVHLWNGDGAYREATLHFQADGIAAMVTRLLPAQDSPIPRLTLIQALPEGDKMDWIIEKACEAGVDRIVPVQARRSVVRLSAERAAKRFEHWQRVAIAACSQCGRARLPDLQAVENAQTHFHNAAALHDLRLLLDPTATTSASRLVIEWLAKPVGRLGQASADQPPQAPGIAIAIGPEGGWDPSELTDAAKAGFQPALLQGNTLRTETAGLYASAQIRAWIELREETAPAPQSPPA